MVCFFRKRHFPNPSDIWTGSTAVEIWTTIYPPFLSLLISSAKNWLFGNTWSSTEKMIFFIFWNVCILHWYLIFEYSYRTTKSVVQCSIWRHFVPTFGHQLWRRLMCDCHASCVGPKCGFARLCLVSTSAVAEGTRHTTTSQYGAWTG